MTKPSVPRQLRPMPADFASFAPGKTNRKIQAYFHCNSDAIQRWRKESGIAPDSPGKQREAMPADFREIAPKITVTGAVKHYGKNLRAIMRWHREAGTSPLVYVPPKRGTIPSYNIRQPVQLAAPGDGSIASAAANHLRRTGFVNVYRATVLDRAQRHHLPDEGKYHYAVSGRGFLHQDDMITLASLHGFQRAA